jgi:hypothetical protein
MNSDKNVSRQAKYFHWSRQKYHCKTTKKSVKGDKNISVGQQKNFSVRQQKYQCKMTKISV